MIVYREIPVQVAGQTRRLNLTKTGKIQFADVNMRHIRTYDALAGSDGIEERYLKAYRDNSLVGLGGRQPYHTGVMKLLLRSCFDLPEDTHITLAWSTDPPRMGSTVAEWDDTPRIEVQFGWNWFRHVYQWGIALYTAPDGARELILQHSVAIAAIAARTQGTNVRTGLPHFFLRRIEGGEYLQLARKCI